MQPAEFGKIIMIIVFAKFVSDNKERLNKLSTLAAAGILYVIPVFLVMREPDLSTSLVYVFYSASFYLLAG